MQHHTKQRLKAGGRDLTLRLCTGGGVLLGLLWGFNNPPAPKKPPTCTTANCVGDVVSKSLSDGVWSVLGPALIGGAIGLAVALVIVLTLLRPRRGGGPSSGRATNLSGRWIQAKYDGRCAGCRRQIRRGDPIFHSPAPRRTLCGACVDRLTNRV